MPLTKKDGEKLIGNIAKAIEQEKWLEHDVDKLEREGKLKKKEADEIRKRQEQAKKNIGKLEDEITKTIVARFPAWFGKPRGEKKVEEVPTEPKEIIVPKEEPAIIEVPKSVLERISSGIETQAAYFSSYEEIAKKQLEAFNTIKEATEEEKAIREDYSEFVYPPSGGTMRIPIGTTVLDLWTGDVYLGDGKEGKLSGSLMSVGQLYARSVYIDTNKAFTVQLDGKTPHSISGSGFFSRKGIQCRKVSVDVEEAALLKFIASTNPDAAFAETSIQGPVSDRDRNTNIVGQDLAQVIQRPKYGHGMDVEYSDIIAEGDSDDIISIAGTGVVYGGTVLLNSVGDTDYFYLTPELDGAAFGFSSPSGLNYWQVISPAEYIMYEKYYSEHWGKYIIGLTGGVTFETSYVLQLANLSGSGASVTVDTVLWYALI